MEGGDTGNIVSGKVTHDDNSLKREDGELRQCE